MKCPKCHSDIPSDTRFCSNCGTQLIPAEEISFPPNETACIAALLGDKEHAMVLLRDALGQGIDYTWLHPEMNLEPLHDYPPFKELIKPKR